MFIKPVQFHEFLKDRGLVHDVYKAMDHSDTAEIVMTILHIMKQSNAVPPLNKDFKLESKSTAFRQQGNVAYSAKQYHKALICYNSALLYAPINSRAMKLAYSNRSALLFKLQAFSACLSDIEKCFSMGCPLEVIEKLKRRKEEASNSLWVEGVIEAAKATHFLKKYFEFNVQRNPQIPCASAEVGVMVENQLPKIVAKEDIKVGTVLAIETAFVSQSDPQNSPFSCYHCHKMHLNLIPCDNCCFALFCNEKCKESSQKEYHSMECPIIEVIEAISSGNTTRLVVKAAIKMKLMCESWDELMASSFTTGNRRLKSSSINEIYDCNYKFSLLNFKDERHFLNGPLYNFSFSCATLLHYLEKIDFFPVPVQDKIMAMRSFARIMQFLALYAVPSRILQAVTNVEREKTQLHDTANLGWFSFIGKLKHSCNPNIIAVGMNKKLALVATASIKRGTELTMSYIGHWLDYPAGKTTRQRNMFISYGIICNCIICTGEYKFIKYDYKLTEIQNKHFRKLNLPELKEKLMPINVPEIYHKICKTLAFLSDAPYSFEYIAVYDLFRRCILYLQELPSANIFVHK